MKTNSFWTIPKHRTFVVLIALGLVGSCVALAQEETPAPVDPVVVKLRGLFGTPENVQGLFPLNKIHAPQVVESPVDFGQLKSGARVPNLPPLFPIANPNMDPKGKTFDLNAALLKKPTLIIFWRG